MKKCLFFVLAVVAITGCRGGSNERAAQDSILRADSIAGVNAAAQVAEKARLDSIRLDSIRQDSIAKAKEAALAAKYDPMISKFESLVSKCEKGKYIQVQWVADAWMDAGNLETKLDKVVKSMTPEQQQRYKSLKARFRKFCSKAGE